jgi:hypothetical protein
MVFGRSSARFTGDERRGSLKFRKKPPLGKTGFASQFKMFARFKPRRENKSLPFSRKLWLCAPIPFPHEGRTRRHERRVRDAMDALAA